MCSPVVYSKTTVDLPAVLAGPIVNQWRMVPGARLRVALSEALQEARRDMGQWSPGKWLQIKTLRDGILEHKAP